MPRPVPTTWSPGIVVLVVFRIHDIFGVDPDPDPRIHASD